ncbi:hypothetical protein ACQKJG_18765 [Priestia megaterium]|uniref:hypothetical protein n=1 Tax=Priestia megaterium TaxID=1404 RepID=UPI003D05BB9A
MYLQQREFFRHQDLIQSEYENMVSRHFYGSAYYQVPHIGRLLCELEEVVFMNMVEELANEGIERNDHIEIYGIDQQDYYILALRGSLQGFEYPIVSKDDLFVDVIEYFHAKHICYIDYEGKLMFAPVKEVW